MKNALRRVFIELEKFRLSQMPVGSLFPTFCNNRYLQLFLTNLWSVPLLKHKWFLRLLRLYLYFLKIRQHFFYPHDCYLLLSISFLRTASYLHNRLPFLYALYLLTLSSFFVLYHTTGDLRIF